MSDRTTYLENLWLNQIARGQDAIFPPELYIALATAVADSEAGSFTEVTGGSYVRRTASFSEPLDGVISSSADITYPQATAEWGEVTHFVAMDSGSAGNALYVAPVGTGVPVLFAVTGSDDFIIAPSHSFSDNHRIEVKAAAGLSLPNGLSEDTAYYVVSQSADTFQLVTAVGGLTPVDIGGGAGWIRRVVPRNILTDDTAEFQSGSLQIIAS